MSTTTRTPPVSLVVAYDVMREAANRLVGRVVAIARADGSEEAIAAAVARTRLIDDQVRSVDVNDRDAIAAMDAQLRRELEQLPTL